MAAYMSRTFTRRLLQCNLVKTTLTRSTPQCNGKEKIDMPVMLCASLHTAARRVASKQCTLTALLLSKRVSVAHRSGAIAGVFLRHNSSSSNTASDAAAATTNYVDPPVGYIPPAPPIPEPVNPTVESLVEGLSEPTLQSLGLGSMWPSGLVQQGLELLHIGAGMPWWACIVAGTFCVRLCMFPIVVKAQKMSINLMNHMPTIQKLQLKFTQARQRGNMLEAMRYGGELGEYMKKHNVKPFAQMIMPLVQAPVFVSVFVGLRGMANLPVESMKEGGILFFTDLTITQPFYALPLMTAFTFFLTIEAGVDGMNAKAQTHVMKWFLRGLPFIMWPFISNFPTAMLVYWFSSNTFSLCQVLFLKIPRVREFCGIPKRIEQPQLIQPVKKGFLEGFKESWSNMKASQQVMERQRLDEISYRKAAHGPIIKTYSSNPKLKQKDSSKLKS